MKYKVGDKVQIKSLEWYNENKGILGNVECGDYLMNFEKSRFCGKIVTISSISDVTDSYGIEEDNGLWNWTDEMIEGLVEEEEIEFTEEDKYWCDIMSESDPTTYVLPDGYIFKDENSNVINATKIFLEKKKSKYPQTYEECVKVLRYDDRETFCVFHTMADERLFEALYRLKVCRDAYWKIAGEEMGLGKPWEPDWEDNNQVKHFIGSWLGTIQCLKENFVSHPFAFPTEKMLDAFYDNFKKEIEICKELL